MQSFFKELIYDEGGYQKILQFCGFSEYRGEAIYWVKGSGHVFVLKFSLQGGEGEKREGMQILKQSTPSL